MINLRKTLLTPTKHNTVHLPTTEISVLCILRYFHCNVRNIILYHIPKFKQFILKVQGVVYSEHLSHNLHFNNFQSLDS